MSRRRAGISPTLFPFLAVLVCTLGTLILLLALVAQEARQTAEQRARQKKLAQEEPKREPVAPVDSQPSLSRLAATDLLEAEQFRVTELVALRDQQTADLEQRRDQLTAIEDHQRRLQAQLKQLNEEIELATSPDEALKLDEKTLSLMQDEITKLRAEINELEEEKRGEKPRVIIVPHRGPNGTQRRPIYVQCDADGVTIQPEGERISHAQLLAAAEARSSQSNPLDSALRAVRRHAMRVYGDQVPPYPLLVVQPDGIHTYMAARAAMKDWDDQYGYELVPGDLPLAFPKPDPVLRKEVHLAIHEAVTRQFATGDLAQSYGYGGRGGGVSGGTTSAYGGAGSGRIGSGGTASASSIAESTNQTLAKPVSPNKPAKPLPTLSARSLDQQAMANGFAPPKDRTFGASASPYGEPVPGSGAQAFSAQGQTQSQSEALNRFLAGDLSDGTSKAESADEPHTMDPATQNSQLGDHEGNQDGESASQNLPEQVKSSTPTTASRMNSSAAGSTTSTSMSQQAGGPQVPSSQQSPSQQTTSQSMSQPPLSPPPMVRREGKDWALPSSMAGGVGTEVVRPIAMVCRHDRYELLDQGQVVSVFPFQQDGVYKATLKLATAVRDRVQGWGATLPGGRWQPRLEVSVGPHADQRFHELQTLMQGSGVDVARRNH